MLSALVIAVYVVAAGAATTVDLGKDVTFSSGWAKEPNSCGGSDYLTVAQGSSVRLSWFGNEISSTGQQTSKSGVVTMEVDNLFPADLDLYSADSKCGNLFIFNTGAPPAEHNMTLTYKGPSSEAPDQLNAEFHLAGISYSTVSQPAGANDPQVTGTEGVPVAVASSSPTPFSSAASHNSHVGAIIGGVVGGIAALVAALLAMAFCVMRKRRQARKLLEPATIEDSLEHHVQFPQMIEQKSDEKVRLESPPPSYTTNPNGEDDAQNPFADFDRKETV